MKIIESCLVVLPGMMSHVAERRGCGVIADATGHRAGQQNRGSGPGGGRADSESVVTATVAESATARADQIHYPAFRTWVPVCGCVTVLCPAVRSPGPVQWSMGKNKCRTMNLIVDKTSFYIAADAIF
jgi:hypothetical protein